MKLRDYQNECIAKIHNIKKGNKGLVVSSVGSGKTIIFSKLAADASGRVLIAVPSTELREQAEEKLRMIDSRLDIGSVQGSMDDVEAKIVVATRQSLTHPKSDRMKRMLENGEFEYLIIDECHQAPSQTNKIYNNMNKSVKIIGFTATPYTRECIEIFGEPIFKRTMIDMIDANYLVEPYAMLVQSTTNIGHVKTSKGDFTQGELEEAVNNAERNKLIIESYKKFAIDRKLTLVFAAGRDHGKQLEYEFREERFDVGYIDGETPKEERKSLIHKFKKEKIKILINVMALTTGFDVPETNCIIVCRPTKSRILYEQILGRGLRLADGKDDCLIIDIQDIVRKHDLMSVSDLFQLNIRHGEKYKEAKKRNEEEKIAAEIKMKEMEKLKLEEEIKKKQEIEIVAQRVKIFNRDMKARVTDSKLDWFRVNNLTYALSLNSGNHYVIENIEDKFIGYIVCTDREKKYVEERIFMDNMKDVIILIEKMCTKNSFTNKNSDWKTDKPTEAQKKFASFAKNKWDVHKLFASNSINSVLSKYHKDKVKKVKVE